MILFYWFNLIVAATLGGSVYATGDWREPLSDDDFGQELEARWVIAGSNNLSSVYVWPKADSGYRFVGFRDQQGNDVDVAPSTITSNTGWGDPLRVWLLSNSGQTDDGIVSGANYYDPNPHTLIAVFEPDGLTGAPVVEQDDDASSDSYDLSGRVITTSRGQIIIRRGHKRLSASH